MDADLKKVEEFRENKGDYRNGKIFRTSMPLLQNRTKTAFFKRREV
jgi:hypothetical protein